MERKLFTSISIVNITLHVCRKEIMRFLAVLILSVCAVTALPFTYTPTLSSEPKPCCLPVRWGATILTDNDIRIEYAQDKYWPRMKSAFYNATTGALLRKEMVYWGLGYLGFSGWSNKKVTHIPGERECPETPYDEIFADTCYGDVLDGHNMHLGNPIVRYKYMGHDVDVNTGERYNIWRVDYSTGLQVKYHLTEDGCRPLLEVYSNNNTSRVYHYNNFHLLTSDTDMDYLSECSSNEDFPILG